MLFSSTVFLFQFLPCCFIVYFATLWLGKKQVFTNIALIALSISFYFIGNGYLVLLLVTSIAVNYAAGNGVAATEGKRQKLYLALGIAFNLGLLLYFKYAAFLLRSIESLAGVIGFHTAAPVLAIALPVGISFYTFMSISYLLQVYENRYPAKSIVDYAVYLSLFPHLVAGPIVRYSELRAEIVARRIDGDMFLDGIFRFAIGLARKTIIADSLAVQADRIFALPPESLSSSLAWLGALCYAFQIFYDFSGYTDMAIGLAKMFGFKFPENFNQPYAASSVTEFWRRWHMTLTRWFRDYLYIPLGGNRSGSARTYLNLFTVFLLCGLWHGAAWTFVVWGAYHGVLLVIERLLAHRFSYRMEGALGVVVTFLLVTAGWIFFRSPTIGDAFKYLGAMFNILPGHPVFLPALLLYSPLSTSFYLAVAAFFAFMPPGLFRRFVGTSDFGFLKGAISLIALLISIAYVSESTFRPFIYFRF